MRRKDLKEEYRERMNKRKTIGFSCGCIMPYNEADQPFRFGIKKCPKHPKAKRISLTMRCIGCDKDFDITKKVPSYCPACQQKNKKKAAKREYDTPAGMELQHRKWDCKNYDVCLIKNIHKTKFNCPEKCSKYEHKEFYVECLAGDSFATVGTMEFRP